MPALLWLKGELRGRSVGAPVTFGLQKPKQTSRKNTKDLIVIRVVVNIKHSTFIHFQSS